MTHTPSAPARPPAKFAPAKCAWVKFAPGPWTIVPYGDGDSLVIHVEGTDWRICFMATPGSSPRAMDTIEANAALIAAAPDLYEALDDLSAYFEDGADINLLPQIMAQARAALARARGETL